jgi:hypothetical protein
LFFSNGEFGSSSPVVTSLLATPEILALVSVVPLCAKAGTLRAAAARKLARITILFIDLALISTG